MNSLLSLLLIVTCTASWATPVRSDGIPEPSLVFYGAVVNRETSQPLTSGQVSWRISNATDVVSVDATIINVNGQFYYIALIPLETRRAGSQVFTAAGNALGLPASAAPPTTFSRTATVDGRAATVVTSSRGMLNGFTLALGDRGLIERLDLQVGAVNPIEGFQDWLKQWGLPQDSDPNSDPLGKGMTLMQESIAGTNPKDKNSVFEVVDIELSVQGLRIIWTGFEGRSYLLERSVDLGDANNGYTVLQQNIKATPPLNSFLDPIASAATGGGQFFYRIRVQQ